MRIRPIASSLDRSGSGTPSIFSIEVGAGLAIFDLHPEEYDEADLLAELAAAGRRPACVGALAAVDWAAGRDPAIPAPINLVIDDRPINFDYFNAGNLRGVPAPSRRSVPRHPHRFRMDARVTRRPHREYLNVLGQYNTGFVWHGFLRHVDHRTVTDYESQLDAGRTRVDEITHKYGVRFQPVMIFPYEKDTPRAAELLRRTGFKAKVESMGGRSAGGYYRLPGIGDESVDAQSVQRGFSRFNRFAHSRSDARTGYAWDARDRAGASARSRSAPVQPRRSGAGIVLRFRAGIRGG